LPELGDGHSNSLETTKLFSCFRSIMSFMDEQHRVRLVPGWLGSWMCLAAW